MERIPDKPFQWFGGYSKISLDIMKDGKFKNTDNGKLKILWSENPMDIVYGDESISTDGLVFLHPEFDVSCQLRGTTLIFQTDIKEFIQQTPNTHPLAASINDINAFFSISSSRHWALKICVSGLWKTEWKIDYKWVDAKWHFDLREGILYQPTLVNPRRNLELTIANPQSRQDYQKHPHTRETYFSSSKIEYMSVDENDDPNNHENWKLFSTSPNEHGLHILTIPPKTWHYIKRLNGLALVIQEAADDIDLSVDKEKIDI